MSDELLNKPLVRVEAVSKHFGDGPTRVDALRNVTIDVFPRQIVALLGPSGSGKTTLLNMIGNFFPPDERIITIEDAAELRFKHKHIVPVKIRKHTISFAVKYCCRKNNFSVISRHVRNIRDIN